MITYLTHLRHGFDLIRHILMPAYWCAVHETGNNGGINYYYVEQNNREQSKHRVKKRLMWGV